MNNQAYAIEINNLNLNFNGRQVFDNFNLKLRRGEKVTLTGASGSGKSTLLKCILGFVRPQSGNIIIQGRQMDARGIWELRLSLAYIAQEPDLGTGTVLQVLELPFSYKANATQRQNLKRLPALLERFNLPQSMLENNATTLSGGEKQRIALICALLLERPIILLDEASSALDKVNKQIVAEYFRQTADLSVLSVSHDTEWLSFSDRVVELNLAATGNGGGA